MYDSQMVENHGEARQDEPDADAKKDASDKVGALSALRQTIQDLDISLQNILTLVAAIVMPFLTLALGVPVAIGISVGLAIIVWFLIIRSLKYARAKASLYVGGATFTALLVGCGTLVWFFTRTVPANTPTGPIIVNGDCNATNTGSNGKAESNCGNPAPKQEKK
jgi:hypothetical protein